MSGIIERAMKLGGGRSHPPQKPEVPKAHLVSSSSGVRGGEPTRFDLNFSALERAGYLSPNTTKSKLAEEVRALKRPVLENAFGKTSVDVDKGNVVVVTSAEQGEGKTFTSLNLAMSLAQERDRTVLLVDADLIQRSLTRFLGLDQVRGLTEALSDPEITIDDVLGETNNERMSLIPSGAVRDDSTELLSSDLMAQFVERLATEDSSRIIILDAPPLLATSQGQVLTTLAGQVLVVVEEGKTSLSSVQEALDLLDPNQAVGMVLNKRHHMPGDTSGAYGGYYGSEGSS